MAINESHPDVQSGRERQRYIRQGLISYAPPTNPAIARPLTADELAARGFEHAAAAKYEAMRDWLNR